MKVELTNQETTFKFKIRGLESSIIFNKEESIKISNEQVAMKKELKFTVSGLENKFENSILSYIDSMEKFAGLTKFSKS